ncbi:MAG TPA: hypothetical protein VNA67_11035 [Pseudonocardiaceae bacterium]|nr:hypothetical protein [Pseudonocardiaceae bacterium]
MLATELGLAGVVPVIIDALPTPSGPAKSAAVQTAYRRGIRPTGSDGSAAGNDSAG